MNEVEIERRLTENEARSKSNSHRLDKVEALAGAIHEQNVALAELVAELRYTNKAVADHESRLDCIEQSPLKNASKVKTTVISSIVSGIIMLLVGALVGLILK